MADARPAAVRPRNRKQLILAAAGEAFAQRGYHHVGMEDIAAAASFLATYLAKASVAVPFVVAVGFATAAIALELTERFGARNALWLLAAELIPYVERTDGGRDESRQFGGRFSGVPHSEYERRGGDLGERSGVAPEHGHEGVL